VVFDGAAAIVASSAAEAANVEAGRPWRAVDEGGAAVVVVASSGAEAGRPWREVYDGGAAVVVPSSSSEAGRPWRAVEAPNRRLPK
jgi:hypothetical protein